MSNSTDQKIESTNILGVKVTFSSDQDILQYIFTGLSEKDKKIFISTPNPEMIVHANHDESFRKVLNQAEIALPDGVGVLIASRILGNMVKSRITGVDFVHMLCKQASLENKKSSKRHVRVGFVGGRGDVAERTANCLQEMYPSLEVLFAGEEWESRRRFVTGFKQIVSEKKVFRDKGLDSEWVDILFVAFGFPKQEKWIVENLPKKKIGVAIGVGGAFDYIAGDVARAPKSIRKIGLEWLFRLIVQPWRLRRQLALVEFTWLVVKEKLS